VLIFVQAAAWAAYAAAAAAPLAVIEMPGGGRVAINRQHIEAPRIEQGVGSAQVAIEGIRVVPGMTNTAGMVGIGIKALESAGDTRIDSGGGAINYERGINSYAHTGPDSSQHHAQGDTVTTVGSNNTDRHDVTTTDRHDTVTTTTTTDNHAQTAPPFVYEAAPVAREVGM
jgi:hypothetical protein